MSTTSITAGQAGTSSSASVAILVGRILLVRHVHPCRLRQAHRIAGTAGWFGSIGLPVPTVDGCGRRPCSNWSAALPSSSASRPASPRSCLRSSRVAATLIAHSNFADQMQLLMFQKNLAITGGLLVLAAVGAGALSIDARRG